MNIKITEPISRGDWLAALGYEPEAACETDREKSGTGERLRHDMDKAEKLIIEAARPNAVYRVMRSEDVKTEGKSLAKHLAGCENVIVMALTLGAGVDSLIRKTQITDMAMAVIIDAGASVLADSLCDRFEGHIRENVSGYVTSRFGIGYGDSPLSMQKNVIAYVDGQRRIGLNVTSDGLLVPRKSVTALLGLSDSPVEGRLAACDECVLKEKCDLRKEGRFCGDRLSR